MGEAEGAVRVGWFIFFLKKWWDKKKNKASCSVPFCFYLFFYYPCPLHLNGIKMAPSGNKNTFLKNHTSSSCQK